MARTDFATTHLTIVSRTGAPRTVALTALVTPQLMEQARTDTNAWIKRLRLVPYDGVSMRDRFTYRGDSLWWFTELYLQKMRQLDDAVLTVLALDAAWKEETPTRVMLSGASATVAAAAQAFGVSRGLPVDVSGDVPHPPRLYWKGAQVGFSAAFSRARRLLTGRRVARLARADAPAIAAFVHTAFWRGGDEPDGGQEGYIGPVLDAVRDAAPGSLCLVGVGPRRNFTTRRWWDPVTSSAAGAIATITPIETLAPWSALRGSLQLWRERTALADALVGGSAIRDAARIHGCDLWPVLAHELRGVALVQWPWSARAMDEAGAALDALHCRTVVTYAEAGGWGRALMLEARRRGVRSIGVQHGFIYRDWLNYRHAADEWQPSGSDRGFPAPDCTLLFDRYTESFLLTEGAFPADRLAVTGSPGRDALVSRMARFTDADRIAARRQAGVVAPDARLALLTAKFTEIRDALPALAAAVRQRPDVQLVIKAHPAEDASVYAPFVGGVSNVTVLGKDADLARLLFAADVLLTRNSTVAFDGLVLGLPALVVGRPTNLQPFIDEGLMLGAADEAGIGDALVRLLYDREVRAHLKSAAGAFVERYGLQALGTAAAQAAAAILETRPHQ